MVENCVTEWIIYSESFGSKCDAWSKLFGEEEASALQMLIFAFAIRWEFGPRSTEIGCENL